MNKLLYIIPLMLLLAGGCSSNEDIIPDEIHDQQPEIRNSYYVALNVQLPKNTSTRSETEDTGASNDGEFGGSDNENILRTAEIYFLDGDYNIITSFGSVADTFTERDIVVNRDESFDYRVYVEVDLDEMKNLTNRELYMVVVGNSGITNTLSGITHNLSKGTKEPIDATIGDITISANATLKDYGNDNKGQIMPMVSAKPLQVNIFKGIDTSSLSENELLAAIRALFTGTFVKDSKTNVTCPIGTVDLERGVARIDVRDRTADERATVSEAGTAAWTYIVGDPNDNNQSDFYIRLDRLQAFNINKKSYLFRHAIAGTNEGASTDEEDMDLFGVEKGTGTGYNWIAGHDWTIDAEGYGKTPNFLNPKSSLSGTDASISISTLKDRVKKGTSNNAVDLYHPWRYVTENTIPSKALMDSNEDLDLYATGVAFTFVLQDNTGTADLVYSAGGENYPTGCVNNKASDSDKSICLTMPNGKWINVSPNADNKYELTYYGHLVHNNPNANGLDPMEYGVVRNNAYQIMVKTVSNLPDQQDPRTMYLQLQINVLPWNKRQNDFTF